MYTFTHRISSLSLGLKKEQSKMPRPSLLSSQRRFSLETSMRMFSLIPSTHPLKRKKQWSFSSGHLRKKNRPSSQPSELNLSTLSQEEVEYSKNASQNLSSLLGDESLWDTSDLAQFVLVIFFAVLSVLFACQVMLSTLLCFSLWMLFLFICFPASGFSWAYIQ